MQKVFHFPSPREHYTCDAAVIWCFDHRFHQAFAKFLKRRGMENPDVIKLAGGAKALASGSPRERDFVIDQIRKSITLHGTKLVILMLHSDCGAYGGLQAFGNDAQIECQRQEAELLRARDFVHETIPGIAVQSYFVDFEGVWQAGAPAAAPSKA
jgi:hypothetical protein